VAEYKKQKQKVDDQQEAVKIFINSQSAVLAEALAGTTSDYVVLECRTSRSRGRTPLEKMITAVGLTLHLDMTLRIMVSRHSAFYSPLICSIAAGFLAEQELPASYSILRKGERSHVLIRDGHVDIMQSAVSSNWKPMEQGETPLPVHFAQINQRDGFFLVSRVEDPFFEFKKLEGRTLLADHGLQPLTMLRYAVHYNGADWSKIRVVDSGAPEEIEAAFRAGSGDYVHLQAPAPQLLEQDHVGWTVASVGASMPLVAFSSLCASREFLQTPHYQSFLRAYARAKEWICRAAPEEIAEREASFFPGVSRRALAAAVARYQSLGCWSGGVEIPRDLYEQALNVFEWAGEIQKRHSYEAVCLASPAA
jgi:NitT/TauT family transport system substrate-binding protein